MLSLHTNAAALSTQNSLASTNKALSSSMTKLGTGSPSSALPTPKIETKNAAKAAFLEQASYSRSET